MTMISWISQRYHRVWLGSLADPVAAVHPPPDFDPAIGHLIGNWAALEEPASGLARPRAEEHVHGYLEQAAAIGRHRGMKFACYFLWPTAAVVTAAAVLVLTLF